MTDTTYNGWRNRETWLVNIWFLDCVTEPMTAEGIHSIVSEALDEALSRKSAMTGFIIDMMDVDCIDWDQLAAHTQEMEEAQ